MKAICLTTLLSSIVLVSSSCKKEELAPPVVIKLEILDQNGLPSTVFKHGDSIIFSFTISATQAVVWQNKINFDKSFFGVFQKAKEVSGTPIFMGDPYTSLIIPQVLGIPIGVKDPFYVKIGWNTSKNSSLSDWGFQPSNLSPLPVGEYYTAFTYTFSFIGYKDLPFSTKINFSII